MKAVTLNEHMARKYKGTLLVRFDDTNPSKEKDEFEQSIIEDLARLNVKPDKVSHTSDHFDTIIKYAKKLIKDGNAYMDDTDAEEMKRCRNDEEGIPYEFRDRSPEENMKLFQDMMKGSEKWCMRAKIDMHSKNKCLRDPVFFRTNSTPHLKTKTKYKAYPTYDLACPIVDSIEGVTHAMRTTEYKDRDVMYAWVQDALSLRKVKIQEFARVNFMYTLMSKRKLNQLVDAGAVMGWNDPRFPTVQGIVRRGLQVEAMKNFILDLGFGKVPVDMTWDKIWAYNRKLIDPIAPRFFAVSENDSVILKLDGKICRVPDLMALRAVCHSIPKTRMVQNLASRPCASGPRSCSRGKTAPTLPTEKKSRQQMGKCDRAQSATG